MIYKKQKYIILQDGKEKFCECLRLRIASFFNHWSNKLLAFPDFVLSLQSNNRIEDEQLYNLDAEMRKHAVARQ